MQFLTALFKFREDITNGIYWLAELEPVYFTLFCMIYASVGLFIIGGAMLFG